MSSALMRSFLLAMTALTASAGLPGICSAQDRQPEAAVPETEEEKKERETRRACAAALCATLHNRKPATGQVTCSVQKTWRKEVLTKIMARGKLSWPWGNARCTSDLRFDRQTLIKAMTEPEFEAQFEKHDVHCTLDRDKESYDIKVAIAPKVTFKQGKAVKASLNWGKVEAPTLAKSAVWSVTAADNTFGVLQGIIVDDINDFIQTKCMEVKEAWQGK